jgi:hypothetical protein
MTHEYIRKAPLVRIASVAAAALMTLSVGGFIDLLAFSYSADSQQGQLARTVMIASRS